MLRHGSLMHHDLIFRCVVVFPEELADITCVVSLQLDNLAVFLVGCNVSIAGKLLAELLQQVLLVDVLVQVLNGGNHLATTTRLLPNMNLRVLKYIICCLVEECIDVVENRLNRHVGCLFDCFRLGDEFGSNTNAVRRLVCLALN